MFSFLIFFLFKRNFLAAYLFPIQLFFKLFGSLIPSYATLRVLHQLPSKTLGWQLIGDMAAECLASWLPFLSSSLCISCIFIVPWLILIFFFPFLFSHPYLSFWHSFDVCFCDINYCFLSFCNISWYLKHVPKLFVDVNIMEPCQIQIHNFSCLFTLPPQN